MSLQLAAAKMSEDALNHALDDAMRKVWYNCKDSKKFRVLQGIAFTF